MNRFGLLLTMVMVSLMFADGVWAGPKHYVASYGLDTNPCTLTSPCRSFSHAVDVTDAGGEVIVLDTGGYGSVTITKSISIIAPVGMYASVTPGSDANGITINAEATDTVLIKGLTIKGTPGSAYGIQASTVKRLIVDNCFISELGIDGIYISAPDSEVIILNSKFSSNNVGVMVYHSSGFVGISMNNVEMVNNYSGFYSYPAVGTARVFATVTNSQFYNNTVALHSFSYYASGASVLNLEHCIVSRNASGIYSHDNSATVTRLSNCTVTENEYGVQKFSGSSGTIYTRQNNTIEGNETDVDGVTLTSFSPK